MTSLAFSEALHLQQNYYISVGTNERILFAVMLCGLPTSHHDRVDLWIDHGCPTYVQDHIKQPPLTPH